MTLLQANQASRRSGLRTYPLRSRNNTSPYEQTPPGTRDQCDYSESMCGLSERRVHIHLCFEEYGCRKCGEAYVSTSIEFDSAQDDPPGDNPDSAFSAGSLSGARTRLFLGIARNALKRADPSRRSNTSRLLVLLVLLYHQMVYRGLTPFCLGYFHLLHAIQPARLLDSSLMHALYNYLQRRSNGSIQGGWHVDAVMAIPDVLLARVEEFHGSWNESEQESHKEREEHSGTRWISPAWCFTPKTAQQAPVCMAFRVLELNDLRWVVAEVQNESFTLDVRTYARQPLRIFPTSQNGSVHVCMHQTFEGAVVAHPKRGTLMLFHPVNSRMIIPSDADSTRRCIGDWQFAGFGTHAGAWWTWSEAGGAGISKGSEGTTVCIRLVEIYCSLLRRWCCSTSIASGCVRSGGLVLTIIMIMITIIIINGVVIG